MKKYIVSVIVCLIVISNAKGQTNKCPKDSNTFYYVTFDIRSQSSYPVIMNGVAKKNELKQFNLKDLDSFISSFYTLYKYVPDDLIKSYKQMTLMCLGDSCGKKMISQKKDYLLRLVNNISQNAIHKTVKLQSGQTVFLAITKIRGTFWNVNKRHLAINKTSNEWDIDTIKEITDCYIVADIQYFQKR